MAAWACAAAKQDMRSEQPASPGAASEHSNSLEPARVRTTIEVDAAWQPLPDFRVAPEDTPIVEVEVRRGQNQASKIVVTRPAWFDVGGGSWVCAYTEPLQLTMLVGEVRTFDHGLQCEIPGQAGIGVTLQCPLMNDDLVEELRGTGASQKGKGVALWGKEKSEPTFVTISCRPHRPRSSRFSSQEGQFSVMFLGRPAYKQKSHVVGDLRLVRHEFMTENGGAALAVAYTDYPTSGPLPSQEVFDGAQRGMLANMQAKLIEASNDTLQGFPVRDVRAVEPRGSVVHARLVLRGSRMYMIMRFETPTAKSEAEWVRFRNSFHLD